MTKPAKFRTLRLILGDQLNPKHSWFQAKDEGVLYLVAELHQEATYTRHHIQKLCAFFVAMKKFSDALSEAGHHVLHLTLDDMLTDSQGFLTLPELLEDVITRYEIKHFEYQQPDEYRLSKQLSDWCHTLSLRTHSGHTETRISTLCVDSEHFLLPFSEIKQYFSPNKAVRMENFYRKMRRRFNLLMEPDGEPYQGRWNFDQDNRNKLKKEDLTAIPEPLLFETPIDNVLARLKKHNIPSIGSIGSTLLWPTSRKEAVQLLDYFCRYLLPKFGRFQDAMTAQSPHQWSLYHSRLSFALNTKILSPYQVIHTALKHYESAQNIDIAQIEGFIRQILGWREYVRGMYWINMPDYAQKNALFANRSLPDYFWTAKTHMSCMSHAISQSLEYAYAHHIQRLMVTGNFGLLTGIHPDQLDQWYLGIYIDAIEWVEMPNTRGMSQYADGGLIASKPYAASGAYINKMSDYCRSCHYSVKEKTGSKACPFNSLYWHFMIQHRADLEKNPRTAMLFRNWDKQNDEDKSLIIQRAQWCLTNLEAL